MTLSLDEFMKYKKNNVEMLPPILEFYNINKNKFQRIQTNNPWRKFEQKSNDNWLIANKFNQNDDDKLYSQVRSILNKLSDSNFDSLAKELINLDISKQHHLSKLVELIFNKAILERKFSVMYAKLAKELEPYYIKENETGKNIFFRELLINRCQLMFNNFVTDAKSDENIPKELALGCMTFIGELYNCEILTNRVINNCFALLMMKTDNNKPLIVDCICILMKSVGKNFNDKCNSDCKKIFERLDKLSQLNLLSNKDRFAIMDLFDFKKKNF